MKIIYNQHYDFMQWHRPDVKLGAHSAFLNLSFGLLSKLHPFDGKKFSRIFTALQEAPGLYFSSPAAPVAICWHPIPSASFA